MKFSREWDRELLLWSKASAYLFFKKNIWVFDIRITVEESRVQRIYALIFSMLSKLSPWLHSTKAFEAAQIFDCNLLKYRCQIWFFILYSFQLAIDWIMHLVPIKLTWLYLPSFKYKVFYPSRALSILLRSYSSSSSSEIDICLVMRFFCWITLLFKK